MCVSVYPDLSENRLSAKVVSIFIFVTQEVRVVMSVQIAAHTVIIIAPTHLVVACSVTPGIKTIAQPIPR